MTGPWFADLAKTAWLAAPAPLTLGLTGFTWLPWWAQAMELTFAVSMIALSVWARRRLAAHRHASDGEAS